MSQFSALGVDDIAKWMGIPASEVWSFARRIDTQFGETRRQACKGGKIREITPPLWYAKKVLRELHRALQEGKFRHGSAHGGVKGRSIFTSARKHLGKRHVWTRDVKDCFPSITTESLYDELLRLGFRRKVAQLLSLLFTVRGKVPQGSPVATDAVNLFFYRIDQMMASVAGQWQMTYTRIVDDGVLSGASKHDGDWLIKVFEREVTDRSMTINDKKRRRTGLQQRPHIQSVHNLRVDQKPGVRASKQHFRNARNVAASYVDACRRLTAESLEAVAYKRSRLCGHINFLSQADATPVKYLRNQLAIGDRRVRSRLKDVEISGHKGKWWVVSKRRNEPRILASRWNKRIVAMKLRREEQPSKNV